MLQELATELALAQSASIARSRMRPALPAAPPISTAGMISNPSELLSSGTSHASKVGLRLLSTGFITLSAFPGGRPLIPRLRESGGGIKIGGTQLSCQFVQKLTKP